jgi:ParB-like nuclease domain
MVAIKAHFYFYIMQDEVLCKVYTTTDYDKFKILAANRTVNKLHVMRIRDSMYKKRLICPIIVNEVFEIIDGQHRFSALKECGMHIDYIIVSGYGIYEVKVLNANMKNWSKKDYLDAFCDMGHPTYILFKRFMYLYPDFSIGICELLAKGSFAFKSKRDRNFRTETNKNGVLLVRTFEEGNLSFEDFNKSCEYADAIMEFKSVHPNFTNTKFVRAVIHMLSVEGYDNKKMVLKLEAYGGLIKQYANTRQTLEFLEEIYNFKNHSKISLRML